MKTAFLSIVLLVLSVQVYAQTSQDYFDRGLAKANLEDYRGAILDFTKAIVLNPKFAMAYYRRGLAKTNLKDYRGAILDFTKAIELNPKYAKAYYIRGLAKIRLNDKGGGCLDLSRAGELGIGEAYDDIKLFCN